MPKQLTIADIIHNAIDKDYSVENVPTDLGESMNEQELIKRRFGPGTALFKKL